MRAAGTRNHHFDGPLCDDAASGLSAAGFAIDAAGHAIADNLGKDYVLPAIGRVYAIADVANYARNTLQIPADQLASFFQSGLHLGGDQVQAVLQGAGYAVDDVNHAMNTAYDWASNHLNPTNW